MPEIRPIGGACVWHGHDMAESKRWQRQLSPLQLAEIDAALRGARARGLRWEAMTAADFPLPSFASLAEDIRAELEDGCGLLLLRGLDLIGGACVWHGHDMAESKRWQRQLSPLQLAEIDAALRGARARGLRWEAMTAADFPLPSFASLAEDIRAELEDGCGLLLLRGLDQIGGACVWHGHDMAESKRWQRQLSPLQLAEIDAALRGARARGLRWEAMTAADFPLPSFASLAEDIRAELEDGCGLLLLRGLD